MLRACAVAAVCLTAAKMALAAPPADSKPFSDGLADRAAWEAWIGQQSGDLEAGALYWASQRSLSKPGSCFDARGQSKGAFTDGCVAAQARLGPADNRRRTEPEYRSGWNSYRAPVVTAAGTPKTLTGCRALTDTSARLACYDAIPVEEASIVPPQAAQVPPGRDRREPTAIEPAVQAAAPLQIPTLGATPPDAAAAAGQAPTTVTIGGVQYTPGQAPKLVGPEGAGDSLSWSQPGTAEARQHIYDVAKASTLYTECIASGSPEAAVGVSEAFTEMINRTTSDYVRRFYTDLFLAGQEAGNQLSDKVRRGDVDHESACAWLTTRRIREVENAAAGRRWTETGD